MARKHSKAIFWGMVVGALFCIGLPTYVLTRSSRVVPLIPDVLGKNPKDKHAPNIRYFWQGLDTVVVYRVETEEYRRFNLQTKTDARLPLPKRLTGLSPDGMFAIANPIESSPRSNSWGVGAKVVATAVDSTEQRTWKSADNLLLYPLLCWTRDKTHWFVQGYTPPSITRKTRNINSPQRNQLFRFSLDSPDTPVSSYAIPPGHFEWMGTDSANRLLAFDQNATKKQFGQYSVFFAAPSHISLNSQTPSLVVAAFPLTTQSEPIAPNQPRRFLLRTPPGAFSVTGWALSPDGRKLAWMTQQPVPGLPWVSWLYNTHRLVNLQFWISDLSAEAIRQQAPPRPVYSRIFDQYTPPLKKGGTRFNRHPYGLAWTPDGKYLTFLDDNTLWRLQIE